MNRFATDGRMKGGTSSLEKPSPKSSEQHTWEKKRGSDIGLSAKEMNVSETGSEN